MGSFYTGFKEEEWRIIKNSFDNQKNDKSIFFWIIVFGLLILIVITLFIKVNIGAKAQVGVKTEIR